MGGEIFNEQVLPHTCLRLNAIGLRILDTRHSLYLDSSASDIVQDTSVHHHHACRTAPCMTGFTAWLRRVSCVGPAKDRWTENSDNESECNPIRLKLSVRNPQQFGRNLPPFMISLERA